MRPIDVAWALGMSEQNYLAYESGRNQLNFLRIADFARALGMETRDFFERLHPVDVKAPNNRDKVHKANAWRPVRDLSGALAHATA